MRMKLLQDDSLQHAHTFCLHDCPQARSLGSETAREWYRQAKAYGPGVPLKSRPFLQWWVVCWTRA